MFGNSENPWQLATLLLFGLILGYTLAQIPGSDEAKVVTVENETVEVEVEESNEPVTLEVDLDGSGLGETDAPVVVVEYSDFECFYCRKSYNEMLPELKENYIDTGLVYFEYRHFPLSSIHAEAQKAGEAAECAGDQDAFWDMHDMIFEVQNEGGTIYEEDLKNFAVELGLNTTTFNECLDSGKYEEVVLSDLQEGIDYGVTATPTFFINGYKVVGAQPYSSISSMIDSLLEE